MICWSAGAMECCFSPTLLLQYSVTLSLRFHSFLQRRRRGAKEFERDTVHIGASGMDGIVKIFRHLVKARQQRVIHPVPVTLLRSREGNIGQWVEGIAGGVG